MVSHEPGSWSFPIHPDGGRSPWDKVNKPPDVGSSGRRLVKSSGVTAYDNAVLRAIDKTEVLPKDVDGTVPPTMDIDFRPRD